MSYFSLQSNLYRPILQSIISTHSLPTATIGRKNYVIDLGQLQLLILNAEEDQNARRKKSVAVDIHFLFTLKRWAMMAEEVLLEQ